jgi:UDP-glucuronate decarboxylase
MHPNDGRAMSNVIIQAIQNKPITNYGDGTQTRSLCCVDDLIEALIGLMNSPDDVTGPINLGYPTEPSILELAQTIIELTGSSSSLEYQELPSDYPVPTLPPTFHRLRRIWAGSQRCL